MIRGLYTSGWSMMAINRQVDAITNNIANVNTNGFKRDVAVFEEFPDILAKRINDTRSRSNPDGGVGSMNLGSDIGELFTDYRQGGLVKTDSKLDMSIRGTGKAFFAVTVPGENGSGDRQMYTRDGAFSIDNQGKLVTKEGYAVLGENGPIYLDNEEFMVQEDGTIVQKDVRIGKLLISEFEDPNTLRKLGNNLVQATEDSEEIPFEGQVMQGYVEQSNVNVVKEMVSMISAMRAYEANQKILRTHDETLDKTVNEVGAVR